MKKLFIIFMGLLLFAQSLSAQSPKTDREVYKATGSEGSITGSVRLEGTAPSSPPINLSVDRNCVEIGSLILEDLLVADGRLANAFIFIKSGGAVDRYSFETPASEVVLYHLGCQFVPRVVGLQVNQKLRIENSDSTAHNTHPLPAKNAEWNKSQTPGGAAIESKFGRVETMIPIKCNQHPWQRAYVGVLDHPFFAVSGRDGTFAIKGVPPGEYELVAWREKLGERIWHILVGPHETKTQEVVFFNEPPADDPGSRRPPQ